MATFLSYSIIPDWSFMLLSKQLDVSDGVLEVSHNKEGTK